MKNQILLNIISSLGGNCKEKIRVLERFVSKLISIVSDNFLTFSIKGYQNGKDSGKIVEVKTKS